MKNKNIFFVFLMFFSGVCINAGPIKDKEVINKISKVEIGASLSDLKKVMGNPVSYNKERFDSVEYDVWEYPLEKSKSFMFFTVDAVNSRVMARNIEFSSSATPPKEDFLSQNFANKNFVKYVPCKSRGDEQVLVSSKDGVFISIRNEKVYIVSWADSGLTELRIKRFQEICPQLQGK